MKTWVIVFLLLLTYNYSHNSINNDDFYNWYTYQIDLPEITVKPVDKQKLILLARLITAEDGSQPFESNLWCGQTVFNYAKKKKITFYEAYYKPNRYYGISNRVYKSGRYTSQAKLAAEMLLKGYRPAPDSVLYFIGANDTDMEFVTSVTPVRQIGYHTYCS